jgi:hypothetical protein
VTGNITLIETMGHYVRLKDPKTADQSQISHKQLTIPLGNLQYGQCRDILLKYGTPANDASLEGTILATLDCRSIDSSPADYFIEQSIDTITNLPNDVIQYHRTRANICALLSSIFPLNSVSEHHAVSNIASVREQLEALIFITESTKLTDEYNASLLGDLSGSDPKGQIKLALSTQEYFDKWGKHYLLSLLNAHQKQICNSFKDPGPLMYGKESPLFIKCRDALDYAFDNLPAPKPSNVIRDTEGNMVTTKVDVRQYNRRGNPCFAGECQVRLADGTETSIEEVKKGTKVWTPLGPKNIVAVVATKVKSYEMCRVGELVITEWHPMFADGRWSFPYDVAVEREVYSGTIYSVILERDETPEAHVIRVGGHLAATLGHGVVGVGESNDARGHPFFGDYEKVQRNLDRLMTDHVGTYISVGVDRDRETGLVNGFIPTKITAEGLNDAPAILEHYIRAGNKHLQQPSTSIRVI